MATFSSPQASSSSTTPLIVSVQNPPNPLIVTEDADESDGDGESQWEDVDKGAPRSRSKTPQHLSSVDREQKRDFVKRGRALKKNTEGKKQTTLWFGTRSRSFTPKRNRSDAGDSPESQSVSGKHAKLSEVSPAAEVSGSAGDTASGTAGDTASSETASN